MDKWHAFRDQLLTLIDSQVESSAQVVDITLQMRGDRERFSDLLEGAFTETPNVGALLRRHIKSLETLAAAYGELRAEILKTQNSL